MSDLSTCHLPKIGTNFSDDSLFYQITYEMAPLRETFLNEITLTEAQLNISR